ncbi:TPA: hypothetical protein DEB04_00605 [Candidatus Giovannonibacteria bacterium]|nr:hypothetical protein [Candidatus Giovannonibacteria bacterium]
MINWTEQELIALKTRLMGRVYWAWFLKRVFIPAGLVLAVSGFILVKELSSVHLGIIAGNTLGQLAKLEFLGLANYFWVALRETEFDSFLIMVSAALLAAFFGRRLIRETLNFWTSRSSVLSARYSKF